MSYTEADHRSAHDKSFILDLFPDTPFYASLLDAAVAAQLGQVHEETAPALRLLESAGLHWVDEIDPFDGGPFVGAPTARVLPILNTVRGLLLEGAPGEDAPLAIVSSEEGGAFRAVATPAECEDREVRIGKEAQERLGVAAGDEVAWTPLARRSEARGG
jgi:arginine N-succinyltransferase